MLLSSLPAAPPSPRGVAVTSIADLSLIYEPDVNLVVWAREPGAQLVQACERLALQSFERLKLVIEPGHTGLSRISEWLMGEEEVARDLLELIQRIDSAVQKVAPFHVAVMKGEGWPNNAGRGLVHRSPATTVPRIVATLDPLR